MVLTRGDIYYINDIEDLGAIGSEQHAGRPAVIVSNNMNNRYSRVIEIVYLTAARKTQLPTHVTIKSTPRISTALCEQVHSIDIQRLGNYCATCTRQELLDIEAALLISLGLPILSATKTR